MQRSKRESSGFRPEPGPRTRSSLSARVPSIFERLKIGLTLVDSHGWHALYTPPFHSAHFELEHGVEKERNLYNQRSMDQAARSRKPVVGEHGGFTDLFVPIVRKGKVDAMLVIGQLLRAPPTSEEILERWHSVSGRHGHLGDPEFAQYVSTWLSTRVLTGPMFEAFRRLTTMLAEFAASDGETATLSVELDELSDELDGAIAVEKMWAAARVMTDERPVKMWGGYTAPEREALNMHAAPEYACVGLVAGRLDEVDPVGEVLRRSEFQRACARMARARGDVLCGPIGDFGVMFIIPPERSEARSRAKLLDVGDRAVVLARRQFQLKVHLGIGPTTGNGSLPMRYRHALAAAERALSRGERSLDAARDSVGAEHALRDARAELARYSGSPLGKLAGRFDRYVELAAAHSGYRLEPIAAHLEAGFERLAESFLAAGSLDQKTYDDLCSVLERAAKSPSTLGELFATYRRTVQDLEQAVQKPVVARQERNLRGAVQYIREHASEPLNLAEVARVGGFAPAYFSRLFRQREKVTFGRYVNDLRIERAKQMLARTDLNTSRVAQLSGFASSHYFHRVFKRTAGETPLDYRQRHRT